jgi:ATP-dependent Zn protease
VLARQTTGTTGADLENLVNLAAINAIRHSKEEIGINLFFISNFYFLF